MEPPQPPLPPSYAPSEPRPTPTFSGIPMNNAATNQSLYNQHAPATHRMNSHNGHGPRQPWTTGLCDCCKDPKSCCLTCWCPCIAFGRIAEVVDRGSISCGVSGSLYALMLWAFGCSCMYSCFYRTKLRAQYSLEEKPCWDCCVHCCCESCSLCQEYRELQNRGFNLSLGWHGNMERQRRLAEMRPVVPTAMNR